METNLKAKCMSAACGDLEALVDVVNRGRPEDFQNTEIFEAASRSLELLADSRGFASTDEIQLLKDILEPVLERGMRHMRAQLFGAVFSTVDPRSDRRIWRNAGLLPRAETGHDPEEMLAVGLWRLMDAIATRDGALGVQRCAECKNLFLDGSADQRGRFCGNKCTLRARRRK